MKTASHQPYSESNLTLSPVQYVPVDRADKGPLNLKPARQEKSTHSSAGFKSSRWAVASSDTEKSLTRTSKHRVRALTELIVQLPAGATRDIVSETFTAMIKGEGDIQRLQALTITSVRQLRIMYLSGGKTALLADVRWKIRDFIWTNFGLQFLISPRGLHIAEDLGPDELSAFLRIEANGQVWAGETYVDAEGKPVSLPLSTEDVFERLSEKLLRSIL